MRVFREHKWHAKRAAPKLCSYAWVLAEEFREFGMLGDGNTRPITIWKHILKLNRKSLTCLEGRLRGPLQGSRPWRRESCQGYLPSKLKQRRSHGDMGQEHVYGQHIHACLWNELTTWQADHATEHTACQQRWFKIPTCIQSSVTNDFGWDGVISIVGQRATTSMGACNAASWTVMLLVQMQ